METGGEYLGGNTRPTTSPTCCKETLKPVPRRNSEPQTSSLSCSSNVLRDSGHKRRGGGGNGNQRGENNGGGSLTTVSGSGEGLTSLDWAIVAKTIFPTITEGFTCRPSGSIEKHFKIMYMMCCSTIVVKDTESDNYRNKIGWLLSRMQLVLFWTVATLSSLRSFSDAKYALLWFLFGGQLNWVIKLAYSVTSLLTTLCGQWILCKKSKTIKKMFDCALKYEQNIKTKNKWHFVPTTSAIVTTVLGVMGSVFVVEMRALSAEKVISLLSYQISEDIFLWDSTNLNASSKLLDEAYGTKVNSVTVTLSTIKILQDVAFNVQQGLVWDLLLFVTLTMQFWMDVFVVAVQKVTDNISDDFSEKGKQLGRDRVVVWNMYKDICSTFEAVNNVFEPLLLCFHVTNILRYAIFLERCICSQNVTLIMFVQILYDIVKSEIVYIAASNITHKNKVVRKWLRNWSLGTGKIQLTNVEMDINVVLDEHTDEPLGLGQKDFVTHSYLHFKVLGLAGSLFLLLANKA